MRSPRTATKSSLHLPQLEKAREQQRRPNAAKNNNNNGVNNLIIKKTNNPIKIKRHLSTEAHEKVLNIISYQGNANQNHNEGNSLAIQWLGLDAFTAVAQVPSLVRQLRSRKLRGVAKKEEKKEKRKEEQKTT